MRVLRVTGRMALIPFFFVHYGIFWVVHGVFVWTLFGHADAFGVGGSGLSGGTSGAVAGTTGVDLGAVATGFVGLAVYHVVAFLYWDIGKL